MSRFNPNFPESARTLDAAIQWRDECLVADGSVLSDDMLWTKQGVEEIRVLFNEHPDNRKERFQTKLAEQFRSAPPRAHKLVAEMLWVMNLFPSNIGASAKRAAVIEAFSWSGANLSPGHPMLDETVLRGIGSAGPGFLVHRPLELAFLINAMVAFKAMEGGARNILLSNPEGFARWLDSVPDPGYRQLRHILPFLLFPDHFERIASPGDIEKILSRLGGVPRTELRSMSKVDRDIALQSLRNRLELERGAVIDFYNPQLKIVWSDVEKIAPPTPPPPLAPPPSSPTLAVPAKALPPLNQILFGPPGTGKTYATVNKALEILDPDFLAEHEQSDDRPALKRRFDELVAQNRIRIITFHQSFSYEDFVEGLRAETRSDGSIHYFVAPGVLKTFCETAPTQTASISSGERFGKYTVTESTSELLWLQKPNGSSLPLTWRMLNRLTDDVLNGSITIADIADNRYFERFPDSTIEKYVLNGYLNIIPSLIETIVTRRSAPVRDEPRVLIIDEINRGNVSKIFGDVITLLESSKRTSGSEALAVVLPYSKQAFGLPANLFIVATMNSTDRSLTGIDIALRRRFAFEEMEPEVELLDGVEVEGVDVGKLLAAINGRLESLLDRDHRIGHSYFIDLTIDSKISDLASIFATNIIPLLQEYFFDNWQRIRLVLNDHRKADRANMFVVEAAYGPKQLFGASEADVPLSQIWRLNPDALGRPSAYNATIG